MEPGSDHRRSRREQSRDLSVACRVVGGESVLTDLWPLTAEGEEIGCEYGEISAAVAEHFDHRDKLGGYTGPLLVLHAAGDRLVDRSHAERMYSWGGGLDSSSVA